MAELDLGRIAGSIIHGVTGVPEAALGIVQDWALDTATGNMYEKTDATTWEFRLNIVGSGGVGGGSRILHSAGIPMSDMGNVGDWAISNEYNLYEKTTETTWTPRGNIKGEKGSTGAKGKDGAPGDSYKPEFRVDERGHLMMDLMTIITVPS